jgi:magnesium transporter
MEPSELLSLAYIESYPAEAAQILERHPPEEVASLIEHGSAAVVARALQSMTAQSAASCVTHLTPETAARGLSELSLDEAAAILRRLSEQTRETILSAMAGEQPSALQRLLRHPVDTAGALMDPMVFSLPVDCTVGEAMARVEQARKHLQHYLYVVDRGEALVGVLSLRELLMLDGNRLIADVMGRNVARLPVTARTDEIIRSPHWRRYHGLPVVDGKGSLVGMIPYQTFHRLREGQANQQGVDVGWGALLAVGEAYWLGLAGLLEALSSGTAGPGKDG